jgi:phage recombination protein Bet
MKAVSSPSKRRNASTSHLAQLDKQLGIPDDLPQTLRQVIRASGLSYDTYVRAITAGALRELPIWSQADLERLLLTAKQHNLNPLNREIFMLSSGTETPPLIVVGVDGWSKIMNSHPQFSGVQFQESTECSSGIPTWIECEIYRHDRVVPLRVREYFDEARNDHMSWITHPRRMLRHKCMVQCARIAFGLGGIYDSDEAIRIKTNANHQNRHNKKDSQSKSLGVEALTKTITKEAEDP